MILQHLHWLKIAGPALAQISTGGVIQLYVQEVQVLGLGCKRTGSI